MWGTYRPYYEKRNCVNGDFLLTMIKIPDKCEKGMKQC